VRRSTAEKAMKFFLGICHTWNVVFHQKHLVSQ